jgi:hypothetical protein
MHDNEKGFHGRHVIDKGITRGVHDINSVTCPDMPGGITSMTPLNPDPHGRGFKSPIGDVPSAARPVNDMGPPVHPGGAIDPNPHPANAAGLKQARNTYATPTWERKLR